ncbi:MAG: SufD family Fe-S cluster assembly protein [Pseudomonadota bacterium]
MHELTFQPWREHSAATVERAFAHAATSRGQLEAYKYTKWDKVVALLRPTRSESPVPCPGIEFRSLSWAHDNAMLAELLDLGIDQQPMLLAGFMQAGEIIYAQTTADARLNLNALGGNAPVYIDVAPGTRLTCEQRGGAVQAVYVRARDDAEVVHARDLSDTDEGWHGLVVDIHADASYTLHNFATGGTLQRQDTLLRARFEGARARVDSAAYIAEQAHLDQNFTVQHLAPRTISVHRCHNIARHAAKVTFNGRIYIDRDCPGVEAELNNRNLALDEAATFNTKPELEIYTDDVKCAHGATVGQLDADQLFYFLSRGIDRNSARAQLAQAFLRQCINGPQADDVERKIIQVLA